MGKLENKRLYGIRGAWCTENTVNSISDSVESLITGILNKNNLQEEDIVSIQFSITNDLDILNPAAALRKRGLCHNVALFCSQEAYIVGYLPKTIRVLITAYLNNEPIHVYGGGAEVLRPGFANKG